MRVKIRETINYLEALYFTLAYHSPQKKLFIIGITGTDGKTTTSNIIFHILKHAGKRTGLITTINAYTGSKRVTTGLHVTSPQPKEVYKLLNSMVKNNLQTAVLETTSHAIEQNRYALIRNDIAVYTNVTHEHLDFHATFDEYLHTKSKLIERTTGPIVLNKDDKSFDYLYKKAVNLNKRIITYGIDCQDATVRASNISFNKNNSTFTVSTDNLNFDITTNLAGRYNIYNVLASICVAIEMRISIEKISNALKQIPQIDGRWEVIQSKPFKVIVDFAHTPNALEQVLHRAKRESNGKIKIVFGSAGKRDHSKRALMGEAVNKYADEIILTTEDPRGESVSDINQMIMQNIKGNDRLKFKQIEDREKAIEYAVKHAKDGDIILITGKGHEQSLNLDGKAEIQWDDKKVVQKALESRK
jgi:UDP-N-acetylmuramoyl-L-alanyl-D-glutamate--2,6-diaminopimelate ligase